MNRQLGTFAMLFAAMLMPSLAQGDDASYVGVTFAGEEVDVAAEIRGIVETVRVRLGDRVEVSTLLATFRDEPIRQELAMAEASLQAAQAQRDQQAIELDRARQRMERRQELGDLLSEEELNELASARDAAQAKLAAATAVVDERRAKVAGIRDDLARTEVRAPFAGTVSMCYAEGGALLLPGDPVVRILSPDLWLRFAVPPAVGRHLSLGQPVMLLCEDLGSEHPATIRHISPDVDPMADMIIVEAHIEQNSTERAELVVGMVARVWIPEHHPAN